MRSPGRKATARACAGKPVLKTVHQMRGAVPLAVQEDKTFFQLFQMSKDLEQVLFQLRDETIPDIAAVQAAQDAFNESLNAARARWFELVPGDKPS